MCYVRDKMQNFDLKFGKNLIFTLCLHVYTAQKQLAELKYLKENIKVGHIIIHEDFAENFTLKQQGEIMAAHWNSTQITLFTSIIYYRNLETLKLEHKNYVVVSDDLNHTKDAVFAFNSAIIEDLKQTVAFCHIHFWSDGCGAQFKNRYNMQNLMLHMHYHGVTADWNFFGTAHRKGAVDGLGAVVKRNVWLGILRKQYVINTAMEFAKVAEKEAPHITVKFISGADIQQCVTKFALIEKWEGATSISGIHSMHFAQPVGSDILGLWKHSCFSDKKDPDEKLQILCPAQHEEPSSNACSTELLKISDWVSVMYDDYWWPGVVENIDNKYLYLSFMKPLGKNKFSWPNIPEKDKILKTNILTKLQKAPSPINSRGHFSLPMEEVKKIEDIIDVLGLA